MASFDSIVIGEDFVSEHFFTTDAKKESFLKAVMDRRKVWDLDEAAVGASLRTRFVSNRGELLTSLSGLEEDWSEAAVAESADLLRHSLGFLPVEGDDLNLVRGTRELTVQHAKQAGSVVHLTAYPAGSPDDILAKLGSDNDRLDAGRPLGRITEVGTEKRVELSVSELISEVFLSADAPSWVVVTAGRWLLITQAEKWPLGKWIAADALLVAERAGNEKAKGKELDHFLSVMAADAFNETGEGELWWDTILEGSVKHAVGVSGELRQGIRESIEIIANDVLKRRTAEGLSNEGLDGNDLAKQSLRFLYRILFLLYAEASPEMGVLPVGDDVYDAGYGLDRLRELTLVEIEDDRDLNGTHLYLSLHRLFELVDQGHTPGGEQGDTLTFRSLKADLFRPEATALIDDVQLSNEAVQKVLQLLLLTKQKNKKDRGYISYAELGINQLGSVYEGLMSFTGFIAKEELREVAKNGDASKGSWVVPASQADQIDPKHFVTEYDEARGIDRPRSYKTGEFVYRLAGRERQQSASYYSPEVITKFVVSQALAELLDQHQHTTTAEEILNLTVCEPALGSGAFAIEAVRQLAAEYLSRRQKELGEEIPADEYARELQKVKAHIALHQIHGVDLNSTAVELAEVSLWLDTMVPGLQAPWFGLRLRRGNSLIGARRSLYRADQVASKRWLKETPVDAPLTGLAEAMRRDAQDPFTEGKIHHFLLPSEGWGAAADAKEVKDLVPDAQKALKDWRKGVRSKPNKNQIERLQDLARRVETLWAFALRRLQVAANQSARYVDFFGREGLDLSAGGTVAGAGAASDGAGPASAARDVVTRDEIEASLADANGAYRRLRRVMDAWTALWFWPLTDESVKVKGEFGQTEYATPPSVDEWIETCEALLGKPIPDSQYKGRNKRYETEGQGSFLSQANWEELGGAEDWDRTLSGQMAVELEEGQTRGETVLTKYPWLQVAQRVAEEQGFFHWDLDFASVFARGGFDLQVGNPPWVRPVSDDAALLAEEDPWWQLIEKPTQTQRSEKRAETLARPGALERFIDAAVPTPVVAAYLGEVSTYPFLVGQQPDLYRGFMELVWRNGSPNGVQSLVHPESHFTEKRAGVMRAETYRRLRRHWQFTNELRLYEIGHHISYGIHIYAKRKEIPYFVMASSLYHPRTVEESLAHNGMGPAPGTKDDGGRWDTSPHRDRLINVDVKTLQVWGGLLDEEGTPPIQARMVYVVNTASERVLEKLAAAPRVWELGLQYSSGWHETSGRREGYFEVGSAVPDSWDDVILQGPHFTVATPFAKQPNPTMKNNLDWNEIDLEALPNDFIPRTSYQRSQDSAERGKYDADYTHWEIDGEKRSSRAFYRICWRRMTATTSRRPMHCAVLPPKAAHVDGVYTAGGDVSLEVLVGQSAVLSSMLSGFIIRASNLANIRQASVESLPRFIEGMAVSRYIVERTAEMTFLTREFIAARKELGVYSQVCTALGRERSIARVDAAVALMLGVNIDDLAEIYKTGFAVQVGYDRSTLYDGNGRKVPTEFKKAAEAGEEFRWTHPQSGVEYLFQPPYAPFDREQAMRDAYAELKPLADADKAEQNQTVEDGTH